jgi:hypothetical protein
VCSDTALPGNVDPRERRALAGVTLVIADDSPAVTGAIAETTAWLGATPIQVHDVAALRSAVAAQSGRETGRLIVLLDAELPEADFPELLLECIERNLVARRDGDAGAGDESALAAAA